ncbi:hypothetical protein GCM10022281_12050 [Sphingomonas rosea]|uniref:DUF4178 domain-containing protein n=1 Tax=Sphingomonas rosea TaxID=335605 RepID=A0ABP7U015_9SPHN
MSAARLINCPSCGGSIAIKAAGYSTTVACQYCGSELDVTNPDVRLITEYHQAASAGDLPLGARGTLVGTEWEVIGRLERSDDGASWTEYLLFNPYAGYRWLIEADGEWSLGTALNRNPVTESDDVVTLDGTRFFLDYAPVTTRTNSVVGEFYWRVRAGDTVEATTFSSGGSSLSWERSADEVNWTLTEQLPDGDAVRASFADPAPASPSAGPATGGGPRQFGRKASASPRTASAAQGLTPVKRASDGDDLSKMIGIAIATCFLLLVIGIFFGMSRGSVSQSMTVYTGEPARTMMLGTVTLKRPYQAVTITARGDQFVNKWVDLDYSLVDRRTQQAIDAYGIVEYYAGRDSDGNWTEGSRRETTKFASVPAGTYDVMVEAKAQNWSSSSYSSSTSSSWASGDGSGWGSAPESINLRFTITPGGVFFGNMAMFMLLIFAPIAVWMWRKAQASKSGYRR